MKSVSAPALRSHPAFPRKVRRNLALAILGCLGIALPGSARAAAGDASESFAALDREYARDVRPLLERYCHDCHSAEKQKGDLDLVRFRNVQDARREAKPWEKSVEMLSFGEMPPKGKPQPTQAERDLLLRWLKSFLEAEARERAGDPGRVVLRRLNNVEYTLTVRELTGQPLDPAREFPVDGAAGEGFVNSGEALAMSPSLLDKYLAAAKDIASHAVLLPDGFRFAPGTRKGDWIDELLADIRRLYARHADSSGGSTINLQGIVFDTNTGGRLPVEKYLLATLAERESLARGTATPADVARARGLNPRYLGSLWRLLQGTEPSPVLDPLRARWRAASPAEAEATANALGRDIAQWQAALNRFQTVGHMKPWLVSASPLVARQEVRVKVSSPTNALVPDPTLRLVVTDAGDGDAGDDVVWENPRFVAPGRPELLLRDLRAIGADLVARRDRIARSAAQCLLAAGEALTAPHDRPLDPAELARRHGVEASDLEAWLEHLGIGGGGPLVLHHFTNRLAGIGGHEFVRGWGSPETPNLAANASTQHVRIPGNLKPHGFVIHPSPSLGAGVGWQSPVRGAVRVEARVTHAHPECGNGVTWAVEHRRGQNRQRLASGVAQGGKTVVVPPLESVAVLAGDLVSLVIGPRDGNHACDLTDLEFVIQSPTSASDPGEACEWSLTRDVTSDVTAVNPHPDRLGHPAIWHFYTEPVAGSSDSRPVIPAGSLLARWQIATTDEERRRLAAEVQQLLLAPGSDPAGLPAPDAQSRRQLMSLGGPLLGAARGWKPPVAGSLIASASSPTPRWGLDPALFGRHPDGSRIEPGHLAVHAPRTLTATLPAELLAGYEFVATAALHATSGKDGSAQVEAVLSPSTGPASGPEPDAAPAVDRRLRPDRAILAAADGPTRQRFEAGFAEFRSWFPAALCYPKIVPVDEVITLTVFHREDEPLRRLMLDDAERAHLDRLWEQLHYVGQDALTIPDAYAQLMEYATQDSNPKLFEHLRQPIHERAAVFRRTLADSESRHLEALVEFAGRAYRRPLSDSEKAELPALYRRLRAQDLPHDEAFRLTLARVLVAPSFLYRAEKPAPGEQPGPVDGWELASRLSYFLWSSMPDATLLREAGNGRLQEPDVLVAQARRLLGDSRVRALATEFACQWLHIRDFDSLDEKSERHFPGFGELRDDMYEESIRYFVDLFQRDGSLLELLDSDHAFLNEALAQHYGIPGVQGPEWRRVDGVRKHGRGGVLGMATVLAKQSGASRTSPILRGNWVVETLLGDKLPKPPKGVPPLPDSEADTGELTMRQITERHGSNPECYVCHQRIDPLGYALEQYDAIGRLRQKDLAGRDLDTRTHYKWKDDVIFEGLPGLRSYLLGKRRTEFVRQFCRKLLGYSLGRGIQLSDLPLLEEMEKALQGGEYRFSSALETVVRSPQFRRQRGLEATREETVP